MHLNKTFLTEISCIWGGRGSGKTTLGKAMVNKAKPQQLLFIDPLAEHGMNAWQCYFALKEGAKFVVCNSNSREEQQAVILLTYALSTKDAPIYVICDEAPSYLDRVSDALRKVVFQGRHAAFGMMLIGQRPASVDSNIRSQGAATWWMKLTDSRDIATAAQSLPPDKARSLSTFKAGEYIQHPPPEPEPKPEPKPKPKKDKK